MATKTISVDMEAYERLRQARRSPDESFSRVIKRARWPVDKHTAAMFLETLATSPLPDPATVDQLDAAQRSDAPPMDPWRG